MRYDGRVRSLATLAVVALAMPLALAQANTYAQLVAKHKIGGFISASALETLKGTRVVQLQGTISGFVQSDDGATLPFLTPDGLFLTIRSKVAADWMRAGSVTARVIVQLQRDNEYSGWSATLLGAMASDLKNEVVVKTPKPVVAKAPVTPKGSLSSRTTSSRGRPKPMEGTIPVGPRPTSVKAKPKLAVVSRPMSWNAAADEALPIYIRFIKRENRKLTDAQAEEIARAVLGFSLRYGVDARLIMAVLLTESNFRPGTVSRAGAMGLGQLMPVNVRELGIKDPFDLTENLFGTIKLIRGHLDKYSKKHSDPDTILTLSLAGYNAGDGAVRRYGGVPPYRETQNYVKKVTKLYRELAGIKG